MPKTNGLVNGGKCLSSPCVREWPEGQCGWSVRVGVGAEKGTGQVFKGCWAGCGVRALCWGQGSGSWGYLSEMLVCRG